MNTKWIYTIILCCLTTPTSAIAGSLDIADWMERPGVRSVLLNFHASWCDACEEAKPKLQVLRERYHANGLRVITIHTNDSLVECGQGALRSDELICDLNGDLAQALNITSLPSLLLWSWDGLELAATSNVGTIETALKTYIDNSPRISVSTRGADGKEDKVLRELVRGELARSGKFTLVASGQERALAAKVRRESHIANRVGNKACTLGKEMSANIVAEISIRGDYLSLALLSAETACITHSAAVLHRPENVQAAVIEVVEKLMAQITRGMDGQQVSVIREVALWQKTLKDATAGAYLRYLEVYPQGRFVDLARKEVRALRQAAEDIRRSEGVAVKRQTKRKKRKSRRPKDSGALASKSYVKIRSGTFTMGSPSSESGRNADEGPQRSVAISHDFMIQTHEVTQHQWFDITGDRTLLRLCKWDCPVVGVTLYDAVVYLNRLSKRANLEACYEIDGDKIDFKGVSCRGFRLPTEAEWEYAARAGNQGARYGSLESVAWSKRDSKTSQSVMKKQPNAYGLYDMLGNVWEWTNDIYGDYQRHARLNPTGALEGPYYAVRGGSWYSAPSYVRAAYRGYKLPGYAGTDLGFRAVRTVGSAEVSQLK